MWRTTHFAGAAFVVVGIFTVLQSASADVIQKNSGTRILELKLLPQGNIQVQPRGPIHEAYASPVDAKPSAGPVVATKPPDPVKELPPNQKPVGADVDWYPGYWSWDMDQHKFLWVTGVYRKNPPGQRFVSGYWSFDGNSWRWVSGFWTGRNQPKLTYHPNPPAPVEAGPSLPPRNANSIYAPGYWNFNGSAYMWRPGHWMDAPGNMVYVPSHYVWTPSGYVFVPNYLDYPLEDRGLLFAPVTFAGQNWQRGGYGYQPRYALDCQLVLDSLFVGPGRQQFYYGDYYGGRSSALGYRSWYLDGSRNQDPLFNYYQNRNRNRLDWLTATRNAQLGRIDGRVARPGRTFDTRNFSIRSAGGANSLQFVNRRGAAPLNQPRLADVTPAQRQAQQLQIQQQQFAGQARFNLERRVADNYRTTRNYQPVSVSSGLLNLAQVRNQFKDAMNFRPVTAAKSGMQTRRITNAPNQVQRPNQGAFRQGGNAQFPGQRGNAQSPNRLQNLPNTGNGRAAIITPRNLTPPNRTPNANFRNQGIQRTNQPRVITNSPTVTRNQPALPNNAQSGSAYNRPQVRTQSNPSFTLPRMNLPRQSFTGRPATGNTRQNFSRPNNSRPSYRSSGGGRGGGGRSGGRRR